MPCLVLKDTFDYVVLDSVKRLHWFSWIVAILNKNKFSNLNETVKI